MSPLLENDKTNTKPNEMIFLYQAGFFVLSVVIQVKKKTHIWIFFFFNLFNWTMIG